MIRQAVGIRGVFNLRKKTLKFHFSVSNHNKLESVRIKEIRENREQDKDVNSNNVKQNVTFQKGLGLLYSGKRYRYSASDCLEFYSKGNRNFIEDAISLHASQDEIWDKLVASYMISNSIRGFILHDIMKLCLEGKIDKVRRIFERLSQHGLHSKSIENNWKSLTTDYKTMNEAERVERVASIILEQTVISGEPLLAASFAMECFANNIRPSKEAVDIILEVLMIDKKLHNIYNSYAILRILEKVPPEYQYDLDKMAILKYLLSDSDYVYCANLFYDSYLSGDLERYVEHRERIYDLIECNLKLGNSGKAHSLFIEVSNTNPNKDYERRPNMMALLLKRLAGRDDAMFRRFIEDYVTEELLTHESVVNALLIILGGRSEYFGMFGNIIKKLQTPLRRSTLSSLFEAFVLQGNEDGAEKILRHILKSEPGLNASDINVIIKTLINKRDIEECEKVLKGYRINLSKLGYITILKYLLPEPTSLTKDEILSSLARDFKKLSRTDKIYQMVTTEIVRHITTKVSNRATRSLYSYLANVSSSQSSSAWKKHSISISKYGVPQVLAPLLLISSHNQLDCLKIILDQSLIDEDTALLEWTIDEFRFLGLSVADIAYKIPRTAFTTSTFSEEMLEIIPK